MYLNELVGVNNLDDVTLEVIAAVALEEVGRDGVAAGGVAEALGGLIAKGVVGVGKADALGGGVSSEEVRFLC